MARASTLTLEEIVEINRRMFITFGGFFVPPDNFEHRSALEYILDALNGSMYGQEWYPSVIEKAAALGHTIIIRHVFKDGNKRTGMMACALILDMNGYTLLRGYDDPEAKEIALDTAAGKVDLEAFTNWVQERASVQ
jgi:death-on-curing protein